MGLLVSPASESVLDAYGIGGSASPSKPTRIEGGCGLWARTRERSRQSPQSAFARGEGFAETFRGKCLWRSLVPLENGFFEAWQGK